MKRMHGVFGPHGGGLVEKLGLAQQIDIQVGTLGKAYAALVRTLPGAMS